MYEQNTMLTRAVEFVNIRGAIILNSITKRRGRHTDVCSRTVDLSDWTLELADGTRKLIRTQTYEVEVGFCRETSATIVTWRRITTTCT